MTEEQKQIVEQAKLCETLCSRIAKSVDSRERIAEQTLASGRSHVFSCDMPIDGKRTVLKNDIIKLRRELSALKKLIMGEWY